jgi:dyp-type peroxidase
MRFLRTIILSLSLVFFALAQNETTADAVLKEFDIDAKFVNNSHFTEIKNNIRHSKKKEFIETVKSGYNHIPALQKIIKDSGVPESFLYLAMIESGFSNHVVSNVNAVGIWQFMAPTAKLYGLRIDKYADERKDPIAATIAATKYLTQLKKDFGKWYLAMMAYNCGSGRLKSAIKKAGTDDITILLDSKRALIPPETRKFVKKILTVSYIAQDKEFLETKDALLISNPKGMETAKIKVPGGTTLMEVGDSIGISLKRMKELNTHLKFVYTPPTNTPYYLYIPKNKEDMFKLNFVASDDRKFDFYTVKENENLLSIAEKIGVSHKIIKEYNALASNDVQLNQKLVIPTEKNVNFLAEYMAKSGDTLNEISAKFDVAFADLQEANSIISSNETIGAKLVKHD